VGDVRDAAIEARHNVLRPWKQPLMQLGEIPEGHQSAMQANDCCERSKSSHARMGASANTSLLPSRMLSDGGETSRFVTRDGTQGRALNIRSGIGGYPGPLDCFHISEASMAGLWFEVKRPFVAASDQPYGI
jgi:hypothetical protein